MSTYKLIYFNMRGRGEVSRFIFAQAGVKYEDKRIPFEEWPELKPKTPYGYLPVLEVDGKELSGSITIARFLGERFGLAGSNDIENADIAGINDVLGDLAKQVVSAFFEKDETRKAALTEELKTKHIPRYMGALEKRAAGSGAPEGWLWGKLTWVDFNCYQLLDFMTKVASDALKDYPTLTKLRSSVESLPNIAKWIQERPQTDK